MDFFMVDSLVSGFRKKRFVERKKHLSTDGNVKRVGSELQVIPTQSIDLSRRDLGYAVNFRCFAGIFSCQHGLISFITNNFVQ